VIITNTIEIRASAAKVFFWLEDPERAMKWMVSVSKSEIVEEKPGHVGTAFREYVEEDGRGLEMRGVITAWEENSRLAFRLESDFNTTEVEFTLHEENGLTRLVQKADMQFKGALKILGIFIAPALVKKIKSQAEGEFAELKRLCESES